MQANSAAYQTGKILAPLRFRSERPDRNLGAPHVRIDGKQETVVLAAVTECFERAHRREGVSAATAILCGNGQSLNAELRAFLPQWTGKLFVAIACDDIIFELFAGEPENLFAKSRLLIVPCKVQGLSIS